MKTLTTLAVATLAGLAAAQSPLSTFAFHGGANNGLGIGDGVYFDLVTTQALRLTDFNVETTSTTVAAPQISVYTCSGPWTVEQNNPAAWTLEGTYTGTVTSAGGGALTPISLPTPILLQPGTTGVYLVYDNITLRYFGTGTTAIPDTVTAELTLVAGASDGDPTPGLGISNSPRCFSGEIAYTPAAGIFPSFSQDVSAGPSPLAVNFTDTTFTDDPGGVLSVRFDFDNDGTYDATTVAGGTVANTFGCGTFDVTIEATDSINGTATSTVVGAVIADEVTASFTQDASLIGTGQTVNFTATATAGATLAWDFDNDGLVDDTNAVASFTYNTAGTFPVTLTATLSCNSVTATSVVDVVGGALFAPPGAAGTFSSFSSPPDASYFDVNVTNPAGYIVQEIFHRSTLTSTQHDMEVWVQTVPGQTVVGNEDDANFMMVASGSAISPATSTELFLVDVNDFVLPPGVTGMAVVSRVGGHTWFTANQGLTASNADVTLTMHSSNSNFETGTSWTSTNSWSGGFVGGPVNDLFPSFAVDVTAGLSPLTVNFTDTSVTNDPIGILSWAWDFENDGLVDDTNQNPTFTYAGCGDFDVSLTVVDATNGSRTIVETGLISTDEFSASFTQDATLIGTSGTLNLTYTGDPAATVSWDWDTDGLVDAIGPTAAATYAAAGTYTITMSAQLNCRSNVVTSTVDVIAGNIIAAAPGSAGTFTTFSTPPDVSYMDVDVANPGGITVEQIFFRSTGISTQHDLEIYVQYFKGVNGDIAASNWTQVSTGTATSAATSTELFAVDVTDFGLPAGISAVAVVTRVGNHTWYVGNAGIASSDGTVTLTPVSSNTNFDTATSATSTNSFSGALIYSLGGGIPGGTVGKLGDGCDGSLGRSEIQPGVQPPVIGTTFAGRVTNVQAGVQIHGGVSRTFNPQFGVPLPFPLGPVLGTQANCQFLVSSDVILLAFPNPFGEAVFSFPIPNNPAFQGLIVYIQGLVFDAGAQGGIVVSDAIFGVIG